MLANNCQCPSCRKLWGKKEPVKKGTRCTKCDLAEGCPEYDIRVLYGFCQKFEPRGKGGPNGKS